VHFQYYAVHCGTAAERSFPARVPTTTTFLAKLHVITIVLCHKHVGLPTLTGQFADKPTRGQSSRGLVNSRTSQLTYSEFLKIMELAYSIE